MTEPRLGIDIGRVIIDGPAHPGGRDTAFFSGDDEAMLATPEMAGAVAAISRLVPRFHGRVWLVSKCGPRTQARTRRWLAGRDFFGRTGLPRCVPVLLRAAGASGAELRAARADLAGRRVADRGDAARLTAVLSPG